MMTKAVTIKIGKQMYQGLISRGIQDMLLQGKMNGKKVNGIWHIPLSELERIYNVS